MACALRRYGVTDSGLISLINLSKLVGYFFFWKNWLESRPVASHVSGVTDGYTVEYYRICAGVSGRFA
ncbi:MAG: hypothetical protein P8X74_12390 [Reinekea sp.]